MKMIESSTEALYRASAVLRLKQPSIKLAKKGGVERPPALSTYDILLQHRHTASITPLKMAPSSGHLLVPKVLKIVQYVTLVMLRREVF